MISDSDNDNEKERENKYNVKKTTKNSRVPVKKHTCPYVGCALAFDRPGKLDRHINTHINERPFNCDHPGCGKAYTNNSHLQRHKSISHALVKHELLQIPCPFPDCKKVFATKWSVKRHCRNHKSTSSYKCVVCGNDFKSHWELKYHVFKHWGLDPFVCETCNESFKTKQELRVHKKKHKVYNCEQEGCQERFKSWNAVRTHMSIAHPNQYDCEYCGKQYKNKWTLREHILSHLPFHERNIILCPYDDCGRYYFYERNLEAHVRSYHHDINYKCDYNECGKTFTTKRRLQDHQKTHTESNESKALPSKLLKPRKPRKDKGLPRRSMAAVLSGINLPQDIDKDLAQNNITPEVKEFIENVKQALDKNNENKDIS